MLDIFDTIKQQTNSPDIVRQCGISLKRKGQKWWGLCPFHNDNKPSLCVWQDSGYYCFSCGAGGDSISFVARYFGLSQLDAVKWIAKEFGIKIALDGVDKADLKRMEQERVRRFKLDKGMKALTRKATKLLTDKHREYHHATLTEAAYSDKWCYAVRNIDYTGYLLDLLMDGEIEDKIKIFEAMGLV